MLKRYPDDQIYKLTSESADIAGSQVQKFAELVGTVLDHNVLYGRNLLKSLGHNREDFADVQKQILQKLATRQTRLSNTTGWRKWITTDETFTLICPGLLSTWTKILELNGVETHIHVTGGLSFNGPHITFTVPKKEAEKLYALCENKGIPGR